MERAQEAYEEEYFTRLTLGKNDTKKKRKKGSKFDDDGLNDFEDLDDFRTFDALNTASRRAQDEERKMLTQQLGSMESRRKRGRNGCEGAGGDDDLPHREPRGKRARTGQSLSAMPGVDIDRVLTARAAADDQSATSLPHEQYSRAARDDDYDDSRGGGGEDDEYYQDARRHGEAKKSARVEKQRRRDERYVGPERDVVDEGAKRRATAQIVRNRGIVAYRKKDDRNPRVHLKNKFSKAEKRRQGAVRKQRDGRALYEGESTGIRKNATHSVRL